MENFDFWPAYIYIGACVFSQPRGSPPLENIDNDNKVETVEAILPVHGHQYQS
jgi:hypothetical protein